MRTHAPSYGVSLLSIFHSLGGLGVGSFPEGLEAGPKEGKKRGKSPNRAVWACQPVVDAWGFGGVRAFFGRG